MIIPHPLIRPTEAPVARWLYSTAVLFLTALPVAMAIANRSSVAFLVLSTLCALGGVAAERGTPALAASARSALGTPLGLAALAFLAWSALSLAWSGSRPISLHYLGEFWLPVGSAFVLALILPQRLSRIGLWTIAGLLALACAIVLFELATGIAYRRALGVRAESFIFNRSTVTILTLSIPVIVGLLRAPAPAPRAGALTLFALVVAVTTLTESDATALGLAVMIGSYGIGRLAPRFVLWAGAAGLLAMLAAAPLLGPTAEAMLPPAVHESLSSAHTRERVEIWTSYGAVVREEPWVGTGFATSARMPSLPAVSRVDPRHGPWLAMNHPHNAALQIWVELGAVGAALAALVVLLAASMVARLPKAQLLAALPLFAATAAISLVSHGAWQGWWAAVVGAGIVLARAFSAEGTRESRLSLRSDRPHDTP